MTKEELCKKRLDEFGLSTTINIFNKEDKFPFEIAVEVHEKTEPFKVFSVELNAEVISRENTFVIAFLEWDNHEPGWELRSVGTRFIEYSTTELNKWILDFCNAWEPNEEGTELIKSVGD